MTKMKKMTNNDQTLEILIEKLSTTLYNFDTKKNDH